MEKDFDKQIKEAFDAFTVSRANSNWSEFEHKLEMAELESDLSFDANIAEHLSGMSIEQSADWPLMEEKIATEKSRRHQVYRMKATELLIFFLLIYTFFQIYPIQLQKQIHSAYPIIADQNPIEENKAIEGIPLEAEIPVIVENRKPSIEVVAKESSLEAKFRVIEAEISQLPGSSISSFTSIKSSSEEFIDEFRNGKKMAVNFNEQLVDNITFNKIPIIDSDIAYLSDPELAFSEVKLNKNLFGKSIWINFYAGMDLDIITTPYDEVYGLNAYTQFSGSNRFGTSISFYQELLEWETGLNYTQKQFQPKLLVKEISGRSTGEYAETSLQNISFSILQIPLQMKYHFVTFKGWRSYAMLGSSLNIVADAKYDVRLKILSDTPNYIGPTPVPEPKINDKEFSSGVLSNGSFYSNSYFTLNAGIGLQKGITGNTALFIEQSYQHHLFSGGIGPNLNKINNFTFVTGIKTNILMR